MERVTDFSRKRIKLATKDIRNILEYVRNAWFFSLPLTFICISSQVKVERSV